MSLFSKLVGKAIDIMPIVDPVLEKMKEGGITEDTEKRAASLAILAIMDELRDRKIVTDEVREKIKEKLDAWIANKD